MKTTNCHTTPKKYRFNLLTYWVSKLYPFPNEIISILKNYDSILNPDATCPCQWQIRFLQTKVRWPFKMTAWLNCWNSSKSRQLLYPNSLKCWPDPKSEEKCKLSAPRISQWIFTPLLCRNFFQLENSQVRTCQQNNNKTRTE